MHQETADKLFMTQGNPAPLFTGLFPSGRKGDFGFRYRENPAVTSPMRRPEEYMSAAMVFCLRSDIEEMSVITSSFVGTKGRNSSNLRMGSCVSSQGMCSTYMVKKRSCEMAQLMVRSERFLDF